MKAADMQTKVATVTVTWLDETVDVGYFPGVMTPNRAAELAAVARDQDTATAEATRDGGLSMLALLLEPVLAWWDVLDEEDNRMPTTAAVMGTLPLGFLTRVQATIQEAMKPEGSKG